MTMKADFSMYIPHLRVGRYAIPHSFQKVMRARMGQYLRVGRYAIPHSSQKVIRARMGQYLRVGRYVIPHSFQKVIRARMGQSPGQTTATGSRSGFAVVADSRRPPSWKHSAK